MSHRTVADKRDDVAGGEPLGTAPPEPLARMAVMPCGENEPLRLGVAVGCRHLHREEVRQPCLQPGLHLTRGEGKAWRGQRSGHGEQERAGHFASGGLFATASFGSRSASNQRLTALVCDGAQWQRHSRCVVNQSRNAPNTKRRPRSRSVAKSGRNCVTQGQRSPPVPVRVANTHVRQSAGRARARATPAPADGQASSDCGSGPRSGCAIQSLTLSHNACSRVRAAMASCRMPGRSTTVAMTSGSSPRPRTRVSHRPRHHRHGARARQTTARCHRVTSPPIWLPCADWPMDSRSVTPSRRVAVRLLLHARSPRTTTDRPDLPFCQCPGHFPQ